MDLKQTVKKSDELVEKSAISSLLLPLWRSVEWQIFTDKPEQTAQLDKAGKASIKLYPGLAKTPNAVRLVLVEFGKLVLLKAGDRGAALWKNKLDLPTETQVATVRDKIKCPELRAKCRTYKDVLNSYPTKGGSVDRLVFINIMNALLANNITYSDSQGVDILTWGPTTEYASLKKYHCLVPLTSAYAPAGVHDEYGQALAEMAIDGLKNVRDSSVAYSLRGIVQRIARMASPV